jgi:very-short-patch-repair endonuclease
VANTAWAFASLKVDAPQLLSAIEARSERLVDNGTPQEVANIVWAFATLKMDAPNLLSKIEARSDWLVDNGNAQDMANIAWAFATIGFEATKFFDALNRNPAVLDEKLNPQGVANLCFAIVIAGRVNESAVLLLKLWDTAIQLFVADEVFLDVEFRQLALTQAFASAWGVELSACPAAMNRRMEETMRSASADDNTVSRSSKEVSKVLRDIGFDHECEVAPERNVLGGMMAIDFACAKRDVAIEYDGELHFLRALGSGELTSKRNGSTKAKRRLLEQLGWTVINLDFRGHMEARRKSKEKAWLRAELKQAGVMLP